ncbi:A/G-specific adenine glycosylase [Auritidibacter ignavus]|uniref:A/G-specific adenine glycosylase n=1 Tax=Auritidibacter ignavus TaxID=678932 RepID=UPI0024B88081|nr:A/G-specific adenine glycosylase [Auritidibacter ignavus]WHS29285.1 A/G-specific adenine glycosylase [Auritidibacter ignavus]
MMNTTALHHKITRWFDHHGRDLPWRRPDCSPWGVLVSEVMLQQTPVVRVLPVWTEWMHRWPTPADLAQAPTAEVLRAWGNLGYPRRALRLQSTATALVERFHGTVPADPAQLRSLPGIGDYTAAAVSSFAFGIPETVIDTNIRRVHARLVNGKGLPHTSLTATEKRLAQQLMPDDTSTANQWNKAVMELGALVCTARSPSCAACPVLSECAWIAAGKPNPDYQPTAQAWHGTDRQVRGAIMGLLRARDSVDRAELRSAVTATGKLGAHRPDDSQWERCVSGLLHDGLIVATKQHLTLP